MPGNAEQLSLFTKETEKPGPAPGLSVRESARAKRLSIKVFPRGRVEVVVPRRTRPAEVRAFVEENEGWIRRSRESFARNYTPEPFALPFRIQLPAIDRSVRVSYARGARKGVRYRETGGVLCLSGDIGDEQAVVAALKRWLSGVARREFEPRLRALSEVTGTPFERVQIRLQRTCWGSRSSSGTISLNLCLLFLTPALARYLMIHELCHGKHMNHSRRFWRFVASFEPDYRRLDRQLSESWRDVPVWLGIY